MKVFYSADHDGHYPVGVCSIVVAETERRARNKLKTALAERGLDPHKEFSLIELDLNLPAAYIVLDGNY